MLAIVLLLFPSLVCFWLVLPCVVLPYTMLGILLTAPSFPTAKEQPQSTAAAAPSGASTGVSAVSATAAAGFGVLGLLSGTISEALTDSATTLALRSELKAGNSELALANHVTVLSSMSLAFWTQSKSERSTKKQVACGQSINMLPSAVNIVRSNRKHMETWSSVSIRCCPFDDF